MQPYQIQKLDPEKVDNFEINIKENGKENVYKLRLCDKIIIHRFLDINPTMDRDVEFKAKDMVKDDLDRLVKMKIIKNTEKYMWFKFDENLYNLI